MNRSDAFGASEAFCHDALNQLTDYAQDGTTDCDTAGIKNVNHNETGNISAKVDKSRS